MDLDVRQRRWGEARWLAWIDGRYNLAEALHENANWVLATKDPEKQRERALRLRRAAQAFVNTMDHEVLREPVEHECVGVPRCVTCGEGVASGDTLGGGGE